MRLKSLSMNIACSIGILFILICCNVSHQHPLQHTIIVELNETDVKPCLIHQDDNGTIIIEASPDKIEPKQGPNAQFNERRRDMFFEDYNIKQIQVIDTSVISNNSLNNGYSKNGFTVNPSSSSPTDELQPSLVPTVVSVNATLLNTIESSTVQPQRPNVLMPKLESSGRPSCLKTPDDTFCETVDNYPKSSIKQEINFSVNQFLEIFGSKEIDGRTIVDVDQDESVCGKKSRIIYPQMAKNQANQWIYVVNEVEYTQAVVAEICDRPGEACAYMDNLPIGMYSKCKQRYSYKRLLALHPTEKRTYSDAFRFPSCCSCHIKIVDDFLGRSKFRKLESKVQVINKETRDTQTATAVVDIVNVTTQNTPLLQN